MITETVRTLPPHLTCSWPRSRASSPRWTKLRTFSYTAITLINDTQADLVKKSSKPPAHHTCTGRRRPRRVIDGLMLPRFFPHGRGT